MTSEAETDLVALTLGAQKLLDEFAAAVRAPAPDAAPVDDDLVAAALGLLSVRRTLERWRLAAVAETPARATPQLAARDEGDWLR